MRRLALTKIAPLENDGGEQKKERRVGEPIGSDQDHIVGRHIYLVSDMVLQIEPFEIGQKIIDSIKDATTQPVHFLTEHLQVGSQMTDHKQGERENGTQGGTRKG